MERSREQVWVRVLGSSGGAGLGLNSGKIWGSRFGSEFWEDLGKQIGSLLWMVFEPKEELIVRP